MISAVRSPLFAVIVSDVVSIFQSASHRSLSVSDRSFSRCEILSALASEPLVTVSTSSDLGVELEFARLRAHWSNLRSGWIQDVSMTKVVTECLR